MNHQVNGHVLAPKNSSKYPASLMLGSHGQLTLSSECCRRQCQLQHTLLSSSIGGMARTITFDGGFVFVCNEPQRLNTWIAEHSPKPLIAKLEGNLGLIILATVFTAIVGYATFVYAVPAAAKVVAHMLPVSVEREVGEHSLNMLNDMGFKESELAPERQAELQRMFNATVGKLDRQAMGFSQQPKLMLRQTGEMANAFALVDGHVILTDAMVKLATNDAQLEAVMLHELGHVQQRHILTNLVQSAILSISAALIVGETSGISDILVSFTVLGTSLSYSRQHEREADEFAATHLQSWYQSTESLVQLYQALHNEHELDIPGWASTHPELTERIESLQHHGSSQ
ncbi:M48 family metallopeptidase [Shewanella sp. GutDb-MelDb]|uniref:M48 family metallopeptidase n=1 Tax=Shewanella sp. GutDb-MelDb TaxID=2058316 RepID=UPI000C7C171C|nr:M48 family metallopeptidase [Shewanella sp. GutDb-MelDb]PKG57138.1 hypothetical protein CXF82_11235 [Shewanella sp. GutDb-MelDb]